MKIYTIGFTQTRAETIFNRLKQYNIQRVVDIRVNPTGQLAGFTQKGDLPYFLSKLVDGCGYVHIPDLAPTKEILQDYRDDSDWSRYVVRFEALMDERRVPERLDESEFRNQVSCLLCSEPTAEKCHRRLVAERLAEHWSNVEIIHL
jgi:uncharacterized protein (DUF488 family)